MNIELIPNRYYVIQVTDKHLLHYTTEKRLIKRYFGNIVCFFKEKYTTEYGKTSYIFEHLIPENNYLFYNIWCCIASNFCHEKQLYNLFTTHIFEDKFVVKKDITGNIVRAIDYFKGYKEFKEKKRKRNAYTIFMLQQYGIESRDIHENIISRIRLR